MTKIVPDTSIIIDQMVGELVQEKYPDAEVLIPEAVLSEIENHANKRKEHGYRGIEELKNLRRLSQEGIITIKFVGRRPQLDEISIAGGGEIDAMIRDIARKYNLVTDTGKMLDAIADKVLVNPVLIVLAANHFIPVIVPVIYVTRDIVVDAIKMQAATKGKVQAAIKSGKYKTACMMVGICLVFFYNIPFEFINIRVDLGLLYIACILSVVSAIEYYNINKELIFSEK